MFVKNNNNNYILQHQKISEKKMALFVLHLENLLNVWLKRKQVLITSSFSLLQYVVLLEIYIKIFSLTQIYSWKREEYLKAFQIIVDILLWCYSRT